MKKTYTIRKSRLYCGVDISALIKGNGYGEYATEKVSVGAVDVSTGKVCFFDPYHTSDVTPFAARLPVGAYEAFAVFVSDAAGKHVALAGLDGGRAKDAAAWRLAYTGERVLAQLVTDARAGGIAVSSGLSAVCDESMAEAYVRLVRQSAEDFHPLDGMVPTDGSCAKVCRIKDVRLPVFAAGRGEGSYRCYVGTDARGEVVGLACDFGLIAPKHKRETGETVTVEIETDGMLPYVTDPKKSDAENSILQYSAVLENARDDATRYTAYARRGYSYHTSGKYKEALADYLHAIACGKRTEGSADFSLHAWSLYDNAALIYREAGRTDDAIALYREALSAPDTFYSGAYTGLIDIYCDSKDYASALTVADEMVAARPQDPSAYVKRSEIFMASEEYEKAIQDLDVLIDTFKLNESILDKALCLNSLGRQKEALTVLDSYLIDGRASEAYYLARSGICLADNNFAAAYIDARNAFDVNPDYPPTLERLIELDGMLFHFKNVIKWVSRYIELRPQAEYGYSIRADAYARLGAYEDAMSDYLHLIHSSKADPKYYALAVRTALRGGNKGLAKKYTKILRSVDNAYYLYACGLLFGAQKKYARARRYIASALAINETDIILQSLAECLIAEGNYDGADNAMKRYARIADSEDVCLLSARIAALRGVPEDAIVREYVKNHLGDCRDSGLIDKVRLYFHRYLTE